MGISVLLQLDNQTAVAYVNKLRGDSFPAVDKTGDGSVDVGPIQGYFSYHRTHPRDYQLCSRCRIQNLVRQNRFESPLRDIQEDQSAVGPTRGGPICIPSIKSTNMILQLATGPISRAKDAFSQHWGPLKGYANPPWCLVLSQVKRQQAQIILVAPVWKGQPWYPVLLGMLFDYPRQLPCN